MSRRYPTLKELDNGGEYAMSKLVARWNYLPLSTTQRTETSSNVNAKTRE